MTTIDPAKLEYNSFTYLPKFPYNCITFLIDNNELVWKLLKYNTSDAWNKTNLTKAQKGALIYNGSPIATDFRVFMDTGIDDSFNIEACILRISVLSAIPNNYIWGSVEMAMEVYSHYKINTLNNYTTRLDSIMQSLIDTFNGADIPNGVGRLYFDVSKTSACKISTVGVTPYKGKVIVFCSHTV